MSAVETTPRTTCSLRWAWNCARDVFTPFPLRAYPRPCAKKNSYCRSVIPATTTEISLLAISESRSNARARIAMLIRNRERNVSSFLHSFDSRSVTWVVDDAVSVAEWPQNSTTFQWWNHFRGSFKKFRRSRDSLRFHRVDFLSADLDELHILVSVLSSAPSASAA